MIKILCHFVPSNIAKYRINTFCFSAQIMKNYP